MDRLTEFKEIMCEKLSPVASEMLCDIRDHYSNAIAKHPSWFCDSICCKDYGWKLQAKQLKSYLMHSARRHDEGEKSYCFAKDVLDAELAEVYAAYSKGDYEQARYEIYDAIAVLLRMEDMIIAKQEANEP